MGYVDDIKSILGGVVGQVITKVSTPKPGSPDFIGPVQPKVTLLQPSVVYEPDKNLSSELIGSRKIGLVTSEKNIKLIIFIIMAVISFFIAKFIIKKLK